MTDLDFQARLQALQVEQAGLNKRTKLGRERNQQVIKEFYAIKDEWRDAESAGLVKGHV